MTSIFPEDPSSPQSLKRIFDDALREYTTETGIDLAVHPLAGELHGCTSVGAVIRVYGNQLRRFKNLWIIGPGRAKVIVALRAAVEAIFTLSSASGEGGALGDGIPPAAHAIFSGLGVLIEAAEQGSTNYDSALVNLFESVNKPVERLVVYTTNMLDITPSQIGSILVTITAQMLRIFALARQKVRRDLLPLGEPKMLLRNSQIDHAMDLLDEMINEKICVVDTLLTCQLDALCERPAAEIEDVPRSLPKILQETYEPILQNIKEEKWEATRRLLQCLLFSARPLLVVELADVLAVDFSAHVAEYKPGWCQESPEQ
ncbi:hypothetical protein BC834DRAFT_1036866, partial [Gloeopeniophorella convolvens]